LLLSFLFYCPFVFFVFSPGSSSLLRLLLTPLLFIPMLCTLACWQIKVVNAFRSSLYEGLEKPESRSSIHNFMTHPEFILEEDEPRTPFLDSAEDDPKTDGLKKRGGGSLGGSSSLNRNNNAVDSDQTEVNFAEPESLFHSLETSV